MIEAFQFEAGGRTYTCRVEALRRARPEAWWWFHVTGDGHRYAPFRAAADDSESDVRSRVVAYYEKLLVRRATPYTPRHWSRRGQGARSPAPTGRSPSPPLSSPGPAAQ